MRRFKGKGIWFRLTRDLTNVFLRNRFTPERDNKFTEYLIMFNFRNSLNHILTFVCQLYSNGLRVLFNNHLTIPIMIKLYLSCVAIFLMSCENKKAKLVTLQKIIKDSLHNIDAKYSTNLLVRSIVMKDSFDKQHPDWRRFGLLDNAVTLDTLNYKLKDAEMNRLDSLHLLLKDKYDSLEFEIKKF